MHCLMESKPELSGADPIAEQVPLARAVPVWGGISQGGFAVVAMHRFKKLKTTEWVKAVTQGKLTAAVKLIGATGKKPWFVLCDNEKFLQTAASEKACSKQGIKLWFVPPRSPDLNPVERFWAWLRRELRQRDLQDYHSKRAPLGKLAYRQRIRAVIKTAKAKQVAKHITMGLKKVCRKVVAVKGAHSGK